ncbi:carboxypeptidase B [Exaiptasia diaphana]|uniref:Peptidase M14 domain-containing protein n=1 Tax=Exaiptasia diaphana TaxID=2652724 RepID=A0A913Y2D8_EXADI|nr:carboxypeptidase B [Exaiptasia diaphana]
MKINSTERFLLNFKMAALWLVMLMLVAASYGHHDKPFRGDKVIRVTPKDESQLTAVQQLEDHPTIKVSFWKEAMRPGMFADIHVPAKYYGRLAKYLNNNGVEFVIQMFDVQHEVDMEEINLGRSGGFFSRYQRLNEIVDEMRRLASQPSQAQVNMRSVGNSYENRPQYYLEIKGRSSYQKPVFFMNCGIHSREWITPASCMYIISQFVNKYGKDNSVTQVLDKMDFIIMPVLNVDGYEYTWKGSSRQYRFWRKTRKPSGNAGGGWWQPSRRCMGTDPNRNWGHKWGLPGASSNPCSDTYRGSSAFSEIETRNVADFMKRLGQRLKGYMDIHAYSQLWMIPWGYTKTPTKDHRELMRVSKAGVDAIRNSGYGTQYRYGSSSVIIYANSGGSKDYTYGELGVKYSFALELRDTGRYGFLLPPQQIIPTCIETFNGIIAMAQEMRI